MYWLPSYDTHGFKTTLIRFSTLSPSDPSKTIHPVYDCPQPRNALERS